MKKLMAIAVLALCASGCVMTRNDTIASVLTLNVILSITGSLSAFEPPYVIAAMGSNGTATYFIQMHQTAHVQHKVGLACAMAVVLVLIICICTLIQKLIFKYAFRNAGTDTKPAKKEVL